MFGEGQGKDIFFLKMQVFRFCFPCGLECNKTNALSAWRKPAAGADEVKHVDLRIPQVAPKMPCVVGRACAQLIS